VTDSVVFTVFTPTYNRAHTLHRVYDSLCAQTLRDFEWLVVDDGSTDNTAGLIVDWVKSADFPIRYFRQEHSGKHIAHNLAVREARGRFFLPFDSDDACVPEALERIQHYWNTIPVGDRSSFFAVIGLCCDQNGNVIGDLFPSNPFDSDLREKQYVYKLRGEKWGAGLTTVIRRYPFPEIQGTQFAPEGIVWLDIAKNYKIRYVNEVLRIYYVNDTVTGVTLSKNRKLSENAPGRLYYHIWILNNDLGYFVRSPLPFLKAAVMIPVEARASKRSLWSVLAALNTNLARILVLVTLPVSVTLYFVNRKTGASDGLSLFSLC
jgi:glycosyltransferase involved in cell wall biosynthesis